MKAWFSLERGYFAQGFGNLFILQLGTRIFRFLPFRGYAGQLRICVPGRWLQVFLPKRPKARMPQ